MKTAFAYWDNRIAPVFDVARMVRIMESDNGRITGELEALLEDGSPVRRSINLSQLGIATLVCGAISRPFLEMIQSNGIKVIPFIAGDLEEVIRAWLDGELTHVRFSMPGCCRRGRGIRRRTCGGREEGIAMNVGGRTGQDRMGGLRAGSATGICVCVKCGHREPHERGIPCVQKKCPACGATLARE